MEIKAGDFIRTKGGNIGQVLKVIPESKYTTRIGCIVHLPEKYWIDTRKGSMSKPYIKKHSPNIIDLIEEGDYVNGSRVIDIVQASVRAVYTEDATQKMALIPIINEDIKSIVTKEQYNSIKYIVGDE